MPNPDWGYWLSVSMPAGSGMGRQAGRLAGDIGNPTRSPAAPTTSRRNPCDFRDTAPLAIGRAFLSKARSSRRPSSCRRVLSATHSSAPSSNGFRLPVRIGDPRLRWWDPRLEIRLRIPMNSKGFRQSGILDWGGGIPDWRSGPEYQRI